jgi:MFS transporter, DHA2 family, multidrug resistance protein
MFNHPFEPGRPTRHGHPPPPRPETSHLHPQFFKPWALRHKWAIWPLLYILLLSALVPFGVFALNQPYVFGHFGAQPEDISFAFELTNVGLIAILTIQFRFLQYFERRTYVLLVIMTSMLLLIADYFARDLYMFMLLRLLTGFLVASMFGPILLLITSLVPPPTTPVITATVFYSVVLGHSTVIGIFFVWVAQHMDWQNIYRYLFLFQALALLTVLLLLNKTSGMRKYPLYQIDWPSFVICIVSLVSLAYALIYGSKFYWFDDRRIAFTAFTATTGSVLLLYRQLQLKRPYWHYAVLKAKHFLIGMTLLFLYFSVKDSIGLIYSYCLNIVRWDTGDVMLLALTNLAGILSFMFLSGLLMARQLIMTKKIHFQELFTIGFSLLFFYHLWMYLIFAPDLSFSDLFLPVFLQGAASGFLLAPTILYGVLGLPSYAGFTGIAVAGLIRLAAALTSFATFYTLQLYFNQLNRESFIRHVTHLDPAVMERADRYVELFRSKGFTGDQAGAIANSSISRALLVQSQLLTDMHIFKAMAILLLVLLLVIILAPMMEKGFGFVRKKIVIRQGL